MDFGPLWQIAGALLAGGAVYGAIRADLKAIHREQARNAQQTDKLEDRFNRHIEQGITHGNP